MIFEAATFFEMEIVLRRCEHFISMQVGNFTNTRLFQLTQTVSRTNRYSPSMSVLISKMANLNETELSTVPFEQIPGDIVADMYAAKIRVNDETKKGNQSKILKRSKSSSKKKPKNKNQGCCLLSWCS